jgi:hypothetical protein
MSKIGAAQSKIEFHLGGVLWTVAANVIHHMTRLFILNPGLETDPSYHVQSIDDTEIFAHFMEFIKVGEDIPLSITNFHHYGKLADEFGIDSLKARCGAFEVENIVTRVSELEERLTTHEARHHRFVARVKTRFHQEHELIEHTRLDFESVHHLNERIDSLISDWAKLSEWVHFQPDFESTGGPIVECFLDAKRPLEGIIHHLSKLCNGNVHERGLVEISASTCSGSAKNVCDLNSVSSFISENSPNQELRFDFKERRILIDKYTIQSGSVRRRGVNEELYLRSWSIDVSDDGLNWEKIDRRFNETALVGKRALGTFTPWKRRVCRFVRLAQDAANAAGSHQLCLGGIELFGQLHEPAISEDMN